MHRRALLAAAASTATATTAAAASTGGGPAAPMGPLAPARDGRYFARPDGVAVYLSGVHTWVNLQDSNAADPPVPFDFGAYLEYMAAHGHTFMRLWSWDSARVGDDHGLVHIAPLPYPRTGPGLDALGKPRFDLTRFDQAYFDRLRARVEAARGRGIYVGVMLWNTWSLHNYYEGKPHLSPWPAHPFHRGNNANGVDGDPRGTSGGAGVQTLAVPAVTALQEAYARKVVETVGDLDNVLYEITNEAIADAPTAAWHNHMIGYLKGLQAGGPHRHRPVGMTGGFRPDVASVNAQLLESGADWISLAGHVPRDREEPPAAPEGRISVLDTDHVFGVGGDAVWVWKAFAKGHSVIYMDMLLGLGIGGLMTEALDEGSAAAQRSGRRGIAGTCAAARLLGDMAGMAPRGELCSTGYALAAPGRGAYVALAPAGGGFTLDLSATPPGRRRLAAHWIEVETGAVRDGGQVEGGAPAPRAFDPPFAPAALVLTPSPA